MEDRCTWPKWQSLMKEFNVTYHDIAVRNEVIRQVLKQLLCWLLSEGQLDFVKSS